MSTTVIGALRVVLGMDSAEFERGVDSVQRKQAGLERSFTNFGKRLTSIGRNLTVGLTAPLTALGVTSVNAFREQEKAVAAVDAALGSMGHAVGFTSGQLQTMASKMQSNSLFGDEDILSKVTANMLTFGNVTGTVFDRAQQSALDLSARFGQDLQTSAVMVGKALNDPIRGLTSLTRTGVVFTEQQKQQIRTMTEAGNVAGAQALILAELERQYGGQAKAAAEADGGITQLRMAWGDFQEQIGAVLVPMIQPLIEGLRSMVDWLSKMDDDTRKVVVGVGLFAAALGPVLMGLGAMITLSAPLLAMLAATGVALPVLAALAAAGALIYANWDKIGPAVMGVAQGLGLMQTRTQAAVGDLAEAFESLTARAVASGATTQGEADRIKAALAHMTANGVVNPAAGEAITDLIWRMEQAGTIAPEEAEKVRLALLEAWNSQEVDKQKSGWFRLGEEIMAVSDQLQAWADAFDAHNERNTESGRRFRANMWEHFSSFTEMLNGFGRDVAAAFENLLNSSVEWMRQLYIGARDWLQTKLGAVFDWVKSKIEMVEGAFAWLYDRVVGNSWIPDMVQGIGRSMAQLTGIMVEPARRAAEQASAAFEEANARIGDSFDDMQNKTKSSFDQMLQGLSQVAGSLTTIFSAIFGNKSGRIFGTLLSAGSQIAGSFGKSIPGLANGGSMMLGGAGGVDRNLLSLNGQPLARVSRGETMSISPANDRRAGVVNNYYTLPSDEFWGRVDGRAGSMLARAAPAMIAAGGQAGVSQMMQMQDRMLG